MKALVAAIAAALLAAPAAAQDSRLAEPFRSLCMAAHGRAGATTAAARSAGFVSPPAMMLHDLANAIPEALRLTVLWKAYEGGLIMTLTGEMPTPSTPPMTAEVCGIATIPAEPGASATLEAVLAVGRPLRRDATDLFVYDEGPDGKRAAVDIQDTGEIRRLMDQGRLRMAMAGGSRADDLDISILMLLVPRAATTAALGDENGATLGQATRACGIDAPAPAGPMAGACEAEPEGASWPPSMKSPNIRWRTASASSR